MLGLVLYGPPAAGKDTVTVELQKLDPRYTLFPRLKVGSGRITGYRMISQAELNQLRAKSEILWENSRYGATYAIDRTALVNRLAHEIPVLHLGQVEAIEAVVAATTGAQWFVVHLWCPREIAAERIAQRNTGDLTERLSAWDETRTPQGGVHLTINTASVAPSATARKIHAHLATLHQA